MRLRPRRAGPCVSPTLDEASRSRRGPRAPGTGNAGLAERFAAANERSLISGSVEVDSLPGTTMPTASAGPGTGAGGGVVVVNSQKPGEALDLKSCLVPGYANVVIFSSQY